MAHKILLPLFLALLIVGCGAGNGNATPGDSSEAVKAQKSKLVGDTLIKYKYSEYADMAEPICEYEIEVTESPSSAVLTINNSEVDSWFRWVPIEVLRHVEQMLIDAKVDTFKSSYSNRDVMDGYSWAFAADYASGEHLASSGTNAGPRGTFIKINQYLDSVYREAENKIKDY